MCGKRVGPVKHLIVGLFESKSVTVVAPEFWTPFVQKIHVVDVLDLASGNSRVLFILHSSQLFSHAKVAVILFPGGIREGRVSELSAELRAWIEKKGLTALGEASLAR